MLIIHRNEENMQRFTESLQGGEGGWQLHNITSLFSHTVFYYSVLFNSINILI
jgi:hypothetical protein